MRKLVCCLTAVVFSLGLAACAAAGEQPAPEVTPQIVAAETSAPSANEAPAQDVIVFNDSVLEGLVREAMRKPEGDITVADALGVTELDMQMQGVDPEQPYIHNLDALRYFTNLTYLGMGYAVLNADDPTAPIDISPLAGMTKLESLQLGGLVIDDISIVANMPNLQSLTVFGGKRLSDISPLAGLTKLQALTLNNNTISDVSPLAGLTNLIYLDLQDNLISDVAPLAGLTKLERLFIADNQITDYSPLTQIRANLVEWDFEAAN